MVVWGGIGPGGLDAPGAAYSPATDSCLDATGLTSSGGFLTSVLSYYVKN